MELSRSLILARGKQRRSFNIKEFYFRLAFGGPHLSMPSFLLADLLSSPLSHQTFTVSYVI